MVNKVFCIVGEENGVKYLKIKKNHSDFVLNKWNQVFDSIKYDMKKISNEEVNFSDGFNKIKFISDDSLRLNKLIYFQTLTVVIRCVFKKGDLLYPQVYQPYVCNECHDFSMTVMDLSNFFILTTKGVDYRVYISGIGKKEAMIIFKKSNLDDKGVLQMDFKPNITPADVIIKVAFGGTYFRDIYSNVNNKWYKNSWRGIQRIQRI